MAPQLSRPQFPNDDIFETDEGCDFDVADLYDSQFPEIDLDLSDVNC